MIVAWTKGERSGPGTTLILGLSDENYRRMQAGDPIYLKYGGPHGLPFNLLIMTGEDEHAIGATLGRYGMLSDETDFKFFPRPGSENAADPTAQ